MTTIPIMDVTAARFAPYGDLLDARGPADMVINQGMCNRHHDRARIDMGGGDVGVSVFDATPRRLPYQLDLMERHPLGSQCFMPMTEHPFLVIVAADDGGKPARPEAFLIPPHTGVNFHRNTWHGVLTPLHGPGLFAVIDRVSGDGVNLEEHVFDTPYVITGQG
ncbi:MAG: ureidoglycolate lyase [Alphaproteobacteria bacterium]|nr:ureidoglycolate lyase [Alphaproteobacteria bacterium]